MSGYREPGRYTLVSVADRDAVLAYLPEHEAELASRVRYGALHDVLTEERCREDAEYLLSTVRELELTDEELLQLVTISLQLAAGGLGMNPAQDRYRELFLAVGDRKRATR